MCFMTVLCIVKKCKLTITHHQESPLFFFATFVFLLTLGVGHDEFAVQFKFPVGHLKPTQKMIKFETRK